ncbi:MAG: OmpA family protein [Burkholderiales bacterium]|nr:OmpA family protein [Burkholderiales bacterium]
MNKKLLCIGALTLAIGACSSNKAPTSGSNDPYANSSNSAANSNSSGYDSGADANVTTSNNDGNNSGSENTLSSNSVYFDTNRYDVDVKYDAVVNYNSDYLANNPSAHVKVEGSTDDVGSVEYNLALGQRRADAVKKSLIAKGANSGQIEATSNGKLVEKFSNADEEGRAQNRRADVTYTKKAPVGYYLNSNGLPAIK